MAGRLLWQRLHLLRSSTCGEITPLTLSNTPGYNKRRELRVSAAAVSNRDQHHSITDTLLPGLWTQCSASSAATVSNFHQSSREGTTEACAPGPVEVEEKRFFPRRAVMYVPACDERKTKKASLLDVDTIVFDIEDGVALNQKDLARRLAGDAVATSRASGRGPHQELVVRVNGVDSGLLGSDLEAVLGRSRDSEEEGVVSSKIPDSIMLPKCDSVEHLRLLDTSLAQYRHPSPCPPPLHLHIIIESPMALLELKDILSYGTRSARHFTLSCVVFGSDDFLAAIGGTRTKSAHELVFARQSLVTHARAFGLDAVDLVDIDYKDLHSLQQQAEEGARMGFTGKQVIHPDQVPVVQQAFSPSPQQTEWALGLIEAFEQHQVSGKGAFVYKGMAIDKPLLLQAENIARLEKILNH